MKFVLLKSLGEDIAFNTANIVCVSYASEDMSSVSCSDGISYDVDGSVAQIVNTLKLFGE